jgi:hypothetical protein
MRDLVFAVHNMQEEFGEAAEGFVLQRATPDEVLALCALLRRIGCGRFLADGTAAALLRGLGQSAELWQDFLEEAARRGGVEGVGRSVAAPMIDAIAAGADARVRRIDALLPSAPAPDLEDAEDFAWADALHGVAAGRIRGAQVGVTAAALAASRSDFLAPRAALLRAAADRDGPAFEDALGALTGAWHAGIEEARAGGITDLSADLTEWNLFLEGAALVRLARGLGVPVAPFYPYLPAELLAATPPAEGA